jgi:hypothetical protein
VIVNRTVPVAKIKMTATLCAAMMALMVECGVDEA